MAIDGIAISAEFQNCEVTLISKHPLLGSVEFSSPNGVVEVIVDRASAEALISALAVFLLQSDDALSSGTDRAGF